MWSGTSVTFLTRTGAHSPRHLSRGAWYYDLNILSPLLTTERIHLTSKWMLKPTLLGHWYNKIRLSLSSSSRGPDQPEDPTHIPFCFFLLPSPLFLSFCPILLWFSPSSLFYGGTNKERELLIILELSSRLASTQHSLYRNWLDFFLHHN